MYELHAARKIAEERAIERIRSVQERVVDAVLRKLRSERRGVLAYERSVLFGQRFRNDGNLLAALEILERRRVLVGEINLRRIEHVKDDQIVAQKPQRFDGLEHRIGFVVKIRNQRDDASPLEVL